MAIPHMLPGELDCAREQSDEFLAERSAEALGRSSAGHAIKRAADQGLSIVLVSADGSTHILNPKLSAN
jgi:hypothetical protein